MKTKIFYALALFTIVILMTSCALQTTSDNPQFRKAAKKLERVEESQSYFGRIAISEPDFVQNNGQFNVNFNEDATNYVQAARNNVSGSASASVQTAYFLGAAAQGMFASPISVGAPGNSTNLPGQMTLPNQAETAVNGFPAPPSLSANPTADERDAVEKGINDKMAEEFLRFMVNPVVDSNSAVVFGIMQATCEPGQRTRKGFIAELHVSVRYSRHEKGKQYYEVSQTNFPDVLGALPLMDSRNMALQNNNQNQVELAAALSAAFAAKGLNASANILSDYVKRQESNIQTLNSLPVATTFSDGSDFGFQLYPAAEALENPASGNAKAANVLEPITFPIVVAIKIEKGDIEKGTNAPWDCLATEVETHWTPIHWGFWRKVWVHGFEQPVDKPFHFQDVLCYMPLYERMQRAEALDEAGVLLTTNDWDRYPQMIPPNDRYEYWQLQVAYNSLKDSAISDISSRPLPDIHDLFHEPKGGMLPAITDIFPHVIWRDANTDFVILMKGITDPADVSTVNIAGYTCPNFVAIPYGMTTNTCTMTVTNVTVPADIVQKINDLLGQNCADLNQSVITNAEAQALKNARGTNVDAGIVRETITNLTAELTANLSAQLISNITTQAVTDIIMRDATQDLITNVVTNFAPQGVVIKATIPNIFYSITNTATNYVDFVVSFTNEPPATRTVAMLLQGKTTPEANIVISRDSNGKLLGVDIKPGTDVTSSNLLEAITQILRKSEAPPKTTTVVP